ncbi:MAG: folate family ECF transporter S component [Clostridia bacterium]|nr:folate family ECF transporter S component [Clostridia bacterium]
MEKNGKKAKSTGAMSVEMLVITALLIAMYVVLDRLVPAIKLPGAKVALSFVAPIVAAILCGPVIGMLVYGLGDLIAALLFPFGQYHPGFTVVAALMGAVFGLFLHKKPFGIFGSDRGWDRIRIFPNVIAAVLINALLGQFVNTLWVAQLYGSKTYWGWFVYRLPQHGFLIAAEIILIPLLMKLCEQLNKAGIGGRRTNKPEKRIKEETSRTKVSYYSTCPGCGTARPKGADKCEFCGRNLIKDEEIVTEIKE